MRIVRYADDFKIFCRTKEDAEKTYYAVKDWLWKRLKLEVSDEKSKVTNLRKRDSEFLGFRIKLRRKSNSWVITSNVCDKPYTESARKWLTVSRQYKVVRRLKK